AGLAPRDDDVGPDVARGGEVGDEGVGRARVRVLSRGLEDVRGIRVRMTKEDLRATARELVDDVVPPRVGHVVTEMDRERARARKDRTRDALHEHSVRAAVEGERAAANARRRQCRAAGYDSVVSP